MSEDIAPAWCCSRHTLDLTPTMSNTCNIIHLCVTTQAEKINSKTHKSSPNLLVLQIPP